MKWSWVVCMLLALGAVLPAKGAPLDGAYRAGDYPRAIKRIAPAAERGNARAQAFLGFMYQYGRGVAQNYALAAYWYRRSAEQGNPTAQHLLGLMYDKGHGVDRDDVVAYKWLSLAAAAAPLRERDPYLRIRDAVASNMSPNGVVSHLQLYSTVARPVPVMLILEMLASLRSATGIT